MKIRLDGVAGRHPAAKRDALAALRGLSLDVAAGEQIAIIGPSGAGKTTLLHLLACALPPSAGSVQLGERNPWQLPRRQLQRLRGELFLAPQVPPLPPRQRVVTSVLAGRLPQIGLWQSLRSLFYPSAIAQAVLGVVGAGGLGQMLAFHMGLFQMQETSSILLAMIGLVALVDACSYLTRRAMAR